MMWKSTVETDRPEMTVWRIRIAYWIPKATNTHSKYVIRIAFPLQKYLHKSASMLRHTYMACSCLLLHLSMLLFVHILKITSK